MLVVALAWTFGLLWLESSGNPVKSSDTGFVTYEKTMFVYLMRFYHLFGLFWLTQFVIACQHMVVAGAVAGWYFKRVKSGLHALICQSLYRLVRYHLGSVAFGSFLVALVQFIRAIMAMAEKQIKKYGGDNAFCNACMKACQCCLYCFEKVLKFINRNAYIEIAIYGYNFCKGAYKSFTLLAANALRVVAINTVGDFVLFIGKVTIVVSTVFIGIEIVNLRTEDPVQHVWAPVGLAGIFAYLTATCFIGVYEVSEKLLLN